MVVLCHNYGRYLTRCLESVYAQSGGFPLEVILVDDASTDNTPEVAQQFLSFPGFSCIRHSQCEGHLRSANAGFALTRGRYILRLDADDYLGEGMLERAHGILSANPEVGLVYGNFTCIDAQGNVTLRNADTVHRGSDFKGNELHRLVFRNFICPPTVVVRRQAWEAVGMRYDESLPFSEDWWVWLRICLKFPVYYCNEQFAYFRVHPSSLRSVLLAQHQAELCHRRILDMFFALPEVPVAVRGLRRRVYAYQYRWLADVYYGRGQYSDSLRCQRICLGWDWRYVFKWYWWRRCFLAVFPVRSRFFRRLTAWLPDSMRKSISSNEDPAYKL